MRLFGQNEFAQLGGLQFVEAAVVQNLHDFVAAQQALAGKRWRAIFLRATRCKKAAVVGLVACAEEIRGVVCCVVKHVESA